MSNLLDALAAIDPQLLVIRAHGKFHLPTFIDAEAIRLFIKVNAGALSLRQIKDSLINEDCIAFIWHVPHERQERKVTLGDLRGAVQLKSGSWVIAGTEMEIFSLVRLGKNEDD